MAYFKKLKQNNLRQNNDLPGLNGIPMMPVRDGKNISIFLWGMMRWMSTADQVADPSSICGWNPDMYGVRATEAGQAYYDSIISLYAGWGVDFIKCDDICDSWLYRDIPQMPFSG